VTSWATYHRPFEDSFKPDLPYTVIQVDLDEGFRLISNFMDRNTKPAYLMKVRAVFDDVTPEITLVKFTPHDAATAGDAPATQRSGSSAGRRS
jgi:uncharacterized OB-fold protein